MEHSEPNTPLRRSAAALTKPVGALLLAGVALCGGRNAAAQSVLLPPPERTLTPAVLQPFATNGMIFSPSGASAPTLASPFFAGPVVFRPHVFYRLTAGDGIPTGGTNQVSTTIQEISPGMLFELGRHWTLDYTPTWRVYANDELQDTLEHTAILSGGTVYGDWTLGLRQSFALTATPLIETGGPTEQENYVTELNASYRFNSKCSLDLAASQRFLISSDVNGFREWSTLDWFSYQIQPDLEVGVGAGFGYVDVDTGADMTYEQLQARLHWRFTDKVSLQLHGGLEDRQFLSGGGADLISPVAGATIQYQPFTHTRLSLNVDHIVTPALTFTGSSQNQTAESTTIAARVNQRLLGHLYLDLGGEYHEVTYSAAGAGASNREDEYYALTARLSCALLKRANVAVFCQWSENSSTPAAFASYRTTQVGVEVGYRF